MMTNSERNTHFGLQIPQGLNSGDYIERMAVQRVRDAEKKEERGGGKKEG